MNSKQTEEMDKVIKFLALELPEPVWNDVNKKWQGFKSGYAAAPQKGIPDEIYNDIADFFKYAKHRGPYTIQKYGGSMIVKFMDGAKAKCSIQMWQGEEVTLNDSPKNS